MDDVRQATLAALFTAVQGVSQAGAVALGDLTASSTRQLLGTLHREGDLDLRALAHRLRIAPPAIAQIAARLEDRGLIERLADPANAHGVLLHLTEDGATMVTEWLRELADSLCPALAHLTAEDWATLAAAAELLGTADLSALRPEADEPTDGGVHSI
ncbi:MarR family winged helix-turn-helix transcriptional regulator [Demequina mangrovi]|uniref:MarR family protein n=1 Tax=Demequina mangrovi TaxID=1043493 RepID=A0A1H6ZT74_9MICO|nr:MarR family winged helix-turn-helix transcriptional regulator [Demequina mangrovi]SEJ52892.1 MarR family protein [Demequina mangrovi]